MFTQKSEHLVIEAIHELSRRLRISAIIEDCNCGLCQATRAAATGTVLTVAELQSQYGFEFQEATAFIDKVYGPPKPEELPVTLIVFFPLDSGGIGTKIHPMDVLDTVRVLAGFCELLTAGILQPPDPDTSMEKAFNLILSETAPTDELEKYCVYLVNHFAITREKYKKLIKQSNQRNIGN